MVDEREQLRVLLDKQAIYEVVVRCARGSDRFDMELLRGTFHSDATMVYDGLFGGDVESVLGRIEEFLATLDGTMHLIANHLVEIRGDIAWAETYVNAYHWATPRDDVSRNFTSVTRYIDRFERRDGEWRIARRVSLRSLRDPEVDAGQPWTGALRGRRDRDDPSYLRN